MQNNKLLTDFRDFKISLEELKTAFGVTRLLNKKVGNPLVITTTDVITAIEKYLAGKISTQTLVDWVNTLWFNEGLYDYTDNQCDSIASVMDLLEELDEEGVAYTDNDYALMIEALKNNTEFSI